MGCVFACLDKVFGAGLVFSYDLIRRYSVVRCVFDVCFERENICGEYYMYFRSWVDFVGNSK